MIAVGIDPGLNGAVAVVGNDDELLGWWDMPTVQLKKGSPKQDFAVVEMRRVIDGIICSAHELLAVYLEVQQARPAQGRSSTFKTGRGYGLLEGIVAAKHLAYELVQPQAWQRSMLAGRSGDTKARSLAAAAALFPELPLTKPQGRKPCMDGRSDAALIALWGLRRMRGEE